MDQLNQYSESMEIIYHILKAFDMAAAKGIINPNAKIIYKHYKNHQLITKKDTLKDVEWNLNSAICRIVRLNSYIKADIINEKKMLSEEEKKKISY